MLLSVVLAFFFGYSLTRLPRLRDNLVIALLVGTGVGAFPSNRWLIGRGMGHAVIHAPQH